MKRCLLLFVALLSALITQAQSIEWNRTFVSSSGDVAPYDVAVHSNDAIYVVGGFRRSTNFGGGYTLVPNSYNGGSNSDGFLVKLDGAGRTKWAKAIATDATSGDALHITAKGNSLYIVSQDANSGYDYYALIEKYDTAGNRIWQRTISNSDSYWVLDMYVDDAENTYLLYEQWQYTYVRKYDSNGTVLYTRTIGSAYSYEPEDIVADAAGNFYISGVTSPASYNRGLIVAKFRPDGTNVFNYVYGGTGNQETYGMKIAIDDTANFYIAGWFFKTVNIGGVSISSPDNNRRAFIAKFDSTGVTKWAKMVDDNSSVHTGAGTGYSAIDIQLSNDKQQVQFVYGIRYREFDLGGNLQNVVTLTAERYFGLSEAPDGSVYFAGENAFTTGYATKIGCGAPAINLPSTIDTTIGSTLNLSIAGSGYTVNWYDGNGNLLAGNTASFSLTVSGDTTIRVDVANAGGCMASKTITINGLCYITQNNTQTICEGTSYQGYTLPGTYRDTLTGTAGCDTIKILQLTVLDTTHTQVVATICAGDTLDGYFASGTYTDQLSGANGCDSIRTLVLTVRPNPASTITTTICFGDSYLGYTATGSYADTFASAAGCDSIRTLNLTVRPQNTTTISHSICQGDSYEGYTASGTYSDVFTDQNGCDSTRVLNLSVVSTIATTINMTVCFGDSYLGYTATGSYADTFASAAGCDSIRTLNLTVRPQNTTTISRSICQGDSYEGYTASGTYSDVFTDQYGCDSTRVLNLSVVSTIATTIDTAICDGESFEGYDATGIYTDTYTSSGGCDSVRTINLTVNVQPTVSLGNDTTICQDSTITLNAGSGFSSYVWSGGETAESITASEGVYTVTVTDANGCQTLDSLTVTATVCVGIGEIELNSLAVYPNPFEDYIYLRHSGEGIARYTLIDLVGRSVLDGEASGVTTLIKLEALPSGTYLLKVQFGAGERIFKLFH